MVEFVPTFKTKNIPVIFSADDNYAAYLGVCIESLIYNSSADYNYDIYILDGGISEKNREIILSSKKSNVSIKMIKIAEYFETVNKDIFYINAHFSLATYYRFFIPRIFENFEKVLYLDCDMIILDDVSKLYNIDLEEKLIAASYDTEMFRSLIMDEKDKTEFKKYLTETLELNEPEKYFQAGVLVLDIAKLNEFEFEKKCLDFLSKITPKYVDQCIMNHVLKNRVKYFDKSWNFEWHVLQNEDLEGQLTKERFDAYIKAKEDIKIVHYCGHIKPWFSPEQELAHHFWFYARLSYFYEKILCKNIVSSLMISPKKLRIKYLMYKILSKISFGKKRKKYKQKRNEMKIKIRKNKSALKWMNG